MFDGSEKVDKDVQTMLNWRRDQTLVCDFLMVMQNVQKFNGWKDDPIRAKVISLKKAIEDFPFLGTKEIFAFQISMLIRTQSDQE